MPTNQEGRQAGARSISGTALDYNGDFLAMFGAAGFSTGTFNERFLNWLNSQMASAYTSLPQAMSAYATATGFSSWGNVNTITDQSGGKLDFSSANNSAYLSLI